MPAVCHRCGAVLEERAAFCPHCGSPQVRVPQREDSINTPDAPSSGVPAASAVTATGAGVNPRNIQWRGAFVALIVPALVVAFVAIPIFRFAFPLWIAFGAAWSCMMYAKRAPGRIIDAGVGARLGAVMGIFTFLLEAIPLGILFVMDAATGQSNLRSLVEQQLHAAVAANNDPQVAELSKRIASSPEALATLMAVAIAFMFVFFLVCGMIGGALGGASVARRRRPGA